MALEPAPSSGSQAAQAGPAAATGGGGAPFGATPASSASPNSGLNAAGVQKLGVALKYLEQAIPLLGSNTEEGQAVLDAVKKLGKFVAAGTVTPAAEKNQAVQMQMQAAQRGPQIAQLRQAAAAGGPPAAAA